jgi:putative oxidoreductase
VNRSLPGPARDVALLIGRLLLGTIMFAHGYQKLMIDGIGRTTQGFESMSIPVAIVSAAFVTVIEVVGGVLVVLGALLPVVAVLYLVVMVGAGVFVHIRNGIFVGDNGWELVGAIAGLLLALAAAGSGRNGVDHLLRGRRQRVVADAPTTTVPTPVVPLPRVPASGSDAVARAAAFTEADAAARASSAFTDVRPRVAVEPPAVPPQPPTRFPARTRGRGPRPGGS